MLVYCFTVMSIHFWSGLFKGLEGWCGSLPALKKHASFQHKQERIKSSRNSILLLIRTTKRSQMQTGLALNVAVHGPVRLLGTSKEVFAFTSLDLRLDFRVPLPRPWQ